MGFGYSPPINIPGSCYGASNDEKSQLLMADEGWEEAPLNPSAPEMLQLYLDDNGALVPPTWHLIRNQGSGDFYTHDVMKFDSGSPQTILSDEDVRTLIANNESGPDITEHLQFQPAEPTKTSSGSAADVAAPEASRGCETIGESVFQQGSWKEFWLKASAKVPEAVSRSYIVRKTLANGTTDISAVTLTIVKDGTFSTQGGTNGTIKLHPSEGESMSLLPVDIVVRKKTESTAPETGLLVKKGDVVTFDINGSAPASSFPLPPESVKWKTRQLKHDGATTAWADVAGQGAELDFTTNESGVFETKAIVTPQGGQASEFPLTRKKDAPHADSSQGQVQDFHKAGAVDYFGVADQQWQIDVRNKVLENLGSEYYKNQGECVVQGSTVAPNPSNKCNIFVYHKCGDAGVPVPLTRGGLPGFRTGPPLAIDWWNDNSGRTDNAGRTITSFDIPNWSRLPDGTMPQPGLVVAHPNLAGEPDQYSSHVGIFDYDGSWISAGFAKVNKYYHPKTSGYQPQGYRKYTGGN